MNNSQIILAESIKLMKEGKISGTGKFFTAVNSDGSKEQIEIPEALNTYAAWKKLGYQVKKGSKAVASFTIWKYTEKQLEVDPEMEKAGDDGKISNMFMKKASFFTISQVEPIKAAAV